MKNVSISRAEASRLNGARSRGPIGAAGKRRSAMNAKKHGLRAKEAGWLSSQRERAAMERDVLAELGSDDPTEIALWRRVAWAMAESRAVERLEPDILAAAGLLGPRPGKDGVPSLDSYLDTAARVSDLYFEALEGLSAWQEARRQAPAKP